MGDRKGLSKDVGVELMSAQFRRQPRKRGPRTFREKGESRKALQAIGLVFEENGELRRNSEDSWKEQ